MKDEYFAGCIYADRYFPLSETEPDDYYQLLNREAAFIYWKTSSQSKNDIHIYAQWILC